MTALCVFILFLDRVFVMNYEFKWEIVTRHPVMMVGGNGSAHCSQIEQKHAQHFVIHSIAPTKFDVMQQAHTLNPSAVHFVSKIQKPKMFSK